MLDSGQEVAGLGLSMGHCLASLSKLYPRVTKALVVIQGLSND